MISDGGDGDDKIILGGSNLERAIGGDGDDIIYGTEIDVDFAMPGPMSIYGDISALQLLADDSLASIGGDDKIYGGDGLQGFQSIYAGPGNDFVLVGSNGASTVLVHGDNPSVGGPAIVEDATGLNIADGDDIIDMGNNHNGLVKMYGQGGNDKLIGGYADLPGVTQTEYLFGGSGDDKIWMVNPEERSFDVTTKNYGYGGLGNDFLYGSDYGDLLIADEYYKTTPV